MTLRERFGRRLAEQTPEQFERVTLGLALERDLLAPTRATLRITTPRFGGTNAKPFGQKALDALHDGVRTLVVDLAAVRDVDRAAMGALCSAHDAFRRAGGSFVLAHLDEDVRALLGYAGILNRFELLEVR